ncbi:arsinothricin resistance N-acetyltransferase ArsN1 [soil metagenome]
MVQIDIRPANHLDAADIARIHNQGIATRNATFQTVERTTEEREQWLASHDERFPVLVAVIDGDVAGWADAHAYRDSAYYAGIAEFSIYIDEAVRGKGVGIVLLNALIDASEQAGLWKLLSRVFVENTASRALCAKAGFREVGIYEKHAQLDGIWRDCIIVERLIPANIT